MKFMKSPIGKNKYNAVINCSDVGDVRIKVRANSKKEALEKVSERLKSQKEYLLPKYGKCRVISVEKEKIIIEE